MKWPLLLIATFGVFTQAPPPGAGLIVGQVVDGTTGRPIPEAVLDLAPFIPAGVTPPIVTIPRVRVISDSSGRFYFADIPAGRYSVRATKAGYLDSRGSTRRPVGFGGGMPITIEIAENQKLLDWRIPLWKYGVISGT